MDEIKDFAEKHPLGTGLIVFVGGLLLLYLLGYIGGGSSSSSANTSGAAAFYQAQAAQAASGNALQAAQLQSAAAVAINQQNAQAYTASQQAWAGVSQQQSADAASVAKTQSNNQLLARQAVTSAQVYDTAVAHGANVWSHITATGGGVNVNQNAVAANPASLSGAGFSPSEINNILGHNPNPNATGFIY